MSRTFDTLSNDTVEVVFDNLGFLHTATVKGDRAVFLRLMQIVTSAVRIDVALTLSRRRSFFA